MSSTEERIVTFIRLHCRLAQFPRALILRVIGIIDTNAYIVAENRAKNVDIQVVLVHVTRDSIIVTRDTWQGLFPVCSIINHSCRANTVCFAAEDMRLELQTKISQSRSLLTPRAFSLKAPTSC